MEELNKDREGDKSNLMIYNGQTIIKGSLFFHEIILPNVSYNRTWRSVILNVQLARAWWNNWW